jgi:hypothetical protein
VAEGLMGSLLGRCVDHRRDGDRHERSAGALLDARASVHDEASQCERAMLVNALDALLAQRGIRFIMRCEGASWPSVREFVRSSDVQRLSTSRKPSSGSSTACTSRPSRG